MRDLSKRVANLEAGTVGALTVRDAIDRPPQETREEWIARQDGLPPPHPPRRNSRGETLEQWIARQEHELENMMTARRTESLDTTALILATRSLKDALTAAPDLPTVAAIDPTTLATVKP